MYKGLSIDWILCFSLLCSGTSRSLYIVL